MRRSHRMDKFVLVLVAGFIQHSAGQESGLPDSLFYVGVGIDRNLDRARSSALNALTQEIQVFISSSFEHRTTEVNTQLDQMTVSKVVGRSIVDLKDVRERRTTIQDGLHRVVKYIPKSSVRHMYEVRRNRILELIAIGERELQGEPMHIGSALKTFYWAMLLSRLYPDTLSFSVRLDSVAPLTYANVQVGISNLFERLLRELEFLPEKYVDDAAIVWQYRVQWRKREVDGLHFEYFDGIGQTEADVRSGRTKLTFFFSRNDVREREVSIALDYRSAEEMDELIRAADSLMSAVALQNRITIILPAAPIVTAPTQKAPTEPVPVMDTLAIRPKPAPQNDLPAPLKEILSVRDNFDAVRQKLDSLVRHSKIILGSASEFESLEGLYGLVVGPEGVSAVLSFKERKYIDKLTGKETDLTKYVGKRITWVEVLK